MDQRLVEQASEVDPRTGLRRTRKFNPLIMPNTTHGQRYIEHLLEMLAEGATRQRKRKARDQDIHERQVAALASGLALQVINNDNRPLSYQRSARALAPRNRYKPSFMTKKLANVADDLERAGLVHQVIPQYNPMASVNPATSIEPLSNLHDIITSAGLAREDFTEALPPEIIVLKSAKEGRWDRGKLIDYKDSPDTHRMRGQLQQINEWIAAADLGFDISFANGKLINTKDVVLRRIFTGGSFDQCGRLCGGFWQGLSKAQRRDGLTINGQPVAVLDYRQMVLRIAYGEAKVQPPSGNLYMVDGFSEELLPSLKKLTIAMLYRQSRVKRMPKGLRTMLPWHYKVEWLTRAIEEQHQSIKHLFYQGYGLRFMLNESEVLIACLEELRRLSIVALPIHDALIVAQDQADAVSSVMSNIAEQTLGIACEVEPE